MIGPLIVFTVTNFNPFLYALISGFLYSGIIIIVGLDIVTLGMYLKSALLSIGIFYVRNVFNSIVKRLRRFTDEDETSEDTTEEEGSDDSLDSSSGSPVDSGDQSIPRDEEPSDANLPADPGLPAEDEGCSQTGSQNLLMALLGALWILRRSTRQDCPLS